MEIPFEILHKIENEHEENVASLYSKNFKTWKKYENKKSKLRLVSDYLTNYFSENPTGIISYDKIAKDLNLKKSSTRTIVSELATWKDWILTIVSTPKVKEHIQLHSKNYEDTETWLLRNQRYYDTKGQRLDKTKGAVSTKKAKEKAVKQKVRAK